MAILPLTKNYKLIKERVTRIKLYVDMDGTLYRFHDENHDYIKKMWQPGFYRNLQPFKQFVGGLKTFMLRHPDVEVYILSSVLHTKTAFIEDEKHESLHRDLPEISQENVLFVPEGDNKAAFVNKYVGKVDSNCFLIDDYNKNLREWEAAGGKSIKFINNVNNQGLGAFGGEMGQLWKGATINYKNSAIVSCFDIERYMEKGKDIKKERIKMQKYNIDEIKKISIIDVLSDYGIEYKKKGSKYWCSLRNERTPSCRIDLEKNLWCDFGDGDRGGSVIELVQTLENTDWKTAMETLAGQYGILPENIVATAFPSEREFKMIGIQADRATKNFDFDIEKYGETRTAEFSQKYAISVAELEKQYPVVYHNMLRSRAIPYLAQERNSYYDDIYVEYNFCRAVGLTGLSDEARKELNATAKGLFKKERILTKAITKPELLKYTSKKYNVNDDLNKILLGTLQIEVGKQSYADIKRDAKASDKRLYYKEVPYEQWKTQEDVLSSCDFNYAAFINVKNESVNVITFSENEQDIKQIFSVKKKERKNDKDLISNSQNPTAAVSVATETKIPEQQKKFNTVVVNMFAGPGAGKTACAWEIAAALKKKGLVVEYVPEAAKEHVWANDLQLLDGSLQGQSALLEEQDNRIQRLMGKVEAIVTDAPILLNPIYLKEKNPEFEKEVCKRFTAQRNFNVFVKRGKNFEQEGRIHSQEESKQLDEKIENVLKENNLYYGKYTYAQITQCVQNIQTSIAKANGRKVPVPEVCKDTIQQYCQNKYSSPKNAAKNKAITFMR